MEWICYLSGLNGSTLLRFKNILKMSEFDRDCITYTQEGRILQLEYANKAVENAEYAMPYAEQLWELNAKTVLYWVPKNSCFPNYLSKGPTPGFSMSTST